MGFYNLKDYENIIFDTIKIKLPTNILSIISELNTMFYESSTTTSTPVSKPSIHNGDSGLRNRQRKYTNNYNKQSQPNMNESWEKMKIFKATKIEKSNGVDKVINDIRIALNKISKSNYTIQKELIFEHIRELSTMCDKHNDNDDDSETQTSNVDNASNFDVSLHRVGVSIFNIVSTNHFYSELYSTLYKELIEKYNIFYEILQTFIVNYMDSIKEIKFVDPNVDYDKHCEYNKMNDSRKALAHFIVNSMKNEILPKSFVINLIYELQTILFEYIDIPERMYEVEEIMENIFLLITKSYTKSEETEWSPILENVQKFSKFKVKEKVSISSRSLFKSMDILDVIAKHVQFN